MRILTATASFLVGLFYRVMISGGLLEKLLVVGLLHEGGLEFFNNLGQLQRYRRFPWPASRLGGLRAIVLEAIALVFGFVNQGLASSRILVNIDAKRRL